MNSSLLVVLLVLAVGSGVQSLRRPGGFRPPSGTANTCALALAPTFTERLTINAALVECIAAQDGLAAIIDTIMKRPRSERHHGGSRLRVDIATALVNAGYTAQATTLRTCIATKTVFMKTDGTFDQEKLEANILAKVAGLTIKANTELGLTNCPDVAGFDVFAFMQCILAYCSTGAAP